MKNIASLRSAVCILIMGVVLSCGQSEKMTAITTIDSEFQNSLDEWTPLLANYKISSDTAAISWRKISRYLPAPLDTTRYGLYLKSNNLGEGMTMLIKKRVGGLTPNKSYSMELEMDLATNLFESGGGSANPSATMVFLKAGTSTTEPDTVTENGFIRYNVSVGSANMGTDRVQVLGDLNNEVTKSEYTLFQRRLTPQLQFTPNEDGEIWLILAVDSNYQGKASLYIDRLVIKLRTAIE